MAVCHTDRSLDKHGPGSVQAESVQLTQPNSGRLFFCNGHSLYGELYTQLCTSILFKANCALDYVFSLFYFNVFDASFLSAINREISKNVEIFYLFIVLWAFSTKCDAFNALFLDFGSADTCGALEDRQMEQWSASSYSGNQCICLDDLPSSFGGWYSTCETV
ncbi:hypothetical protein HQN90_28115 [Paenibacillus alba]|nr:hypothetical protein [Paenibacillus alba]